MKPTDRVARAARLLRSSDQSQRSGATTSMAATSSASAKAMPPAAMRPRLASEKPSRMQKAPRMSRALVSMCNQRSNRIISPMRRNAAMTSNPAHNTQAAGCMLISNTVAASNVMNK